MSRRAGTTGGPDGCCAAVAAKHTTIPAVVRATEADTDAGVWQAVENLSRQDLSPSLEARAVARIMGEGMKQKTLAQSLNRPVSWVRARLALAGLPVEVQEAIDAGRFQPSDALTFARYVDRPEVIAAALESRYYGDLDRTLEQTNRRYDEALAIVASVEDLTERGITAYRGELPANLTARPVSDLAGIDTTAHEAEPCHVAVVRAQRWDDGVEIVAYCTSPERHSARGDSELTVTKPITKRSPQRQAELDRQKADRAAKAHRDNFARDAIMGRIRSKDVAEVVLPVLFAVMGQTELIDAAKLLGVTEPDDNGGRGGSYRDWAGPFKAWATESPANVHRAMLAIAYVRGVDSWYDDAKAVTAAWLDRLGYEPDAE